MNVGNGQASYPLRQAEQFGTGNISAPEKNSPLK
jgi:hypothetical protein